MKSSDILEILAIIAVVCVSLIGVSFTAVLVIGMWRTILNV